MTVPTLADEKWLDLLATRAGDPGAIAKAYAARRRRGRILNDRGTVFLVAADHPARGALASGGDPMAMADRRSLLARLAEALSHPDVDGVLGTPDVVEELLLLGDHFLDLGTEAGVVHMPTIAPTKYGQRGRRA